MTLDGHDTMFTAQAVVELWRSSDVLLFLDISSTFIDEDEFLHLQAEYFEEQHDCVTVLFYDQ